MQVVDNLLVVHNLDENATQLYDLKLEDWFEPMMVDSYRVDYGPVNKGKFISDMLQKEEENITTALNSVRDSLRASLVDVPSAEG